MNSHWNRALVAIALAVFAPLSIAQTITESSGGMAKAGDRVDITFDDAGQPNGVIVITISNGEEFPFNDEVDIEISLDKAGRGSVDWTVPRGWDQAVLSGGGATEVIINVFN